MSRRSKYPRDLDGLALLWRHRCVMRKVEHGLRVQDPLDLLLLVVAPPDGLLAASRDAVRDRVREAAA